jgi:hypothetical protein
MVEAHRFFGEQARQWLTLAGPQDVIRRAATIETVVRDLLQMVVIDLAADENAQEIFETLNARGAQLTAADLVKNFIFQRLLEADTDVEDAYQRHWKEFETGFWEAEVNVGRAKYPRSSVFLNHWLIACTGDEVVAREVFARFKTFADFDSGLPMTKLLERIHRAAGVYRGFVTAAAIDIGPVDRLGLFGYRTGVLESEVIKPLVLCLWDPEEPPIPEAQVAKALNVVESWMVRRMLVRATTKSYNMVVAELVGLLRQSDRIEAGNIIEKYLATQKSDSRYWPDDNEVREELKSLLAYRRLGRGRLRMVLEAIEDHVRGWRDGKSGLGGERIARGKYAIEHVMPRRWIANWPFPDGHHDEAERDRLVHTIGNLTLLTGRLNAKLSNGPWLGSYGKRSILERHDVLMLNRDILRTAGNSWTDELIRARTGDLTKAILEIWPVPVGHRSDFSRAKARPRHKVDIAELMNAGLLQSGTSLFPRRKKFASRVATVLPDGRLDVDGQIFSTPSDAARSISGKRMNGWWFFLVDQARRRSVRDVRREYLEALAVDAEDDDVEDDSDDDES